nr:Gag [Schizosaccharomyces osmophilus]
MEMDSENSGTGFFVSAADMQNLKAEISDQLKVISEQMVAANQEKMAEKLSQMEIDEDYIAEEPMDLIESVENAYGNRAEKYLRRINTREPEVYNPDKHELDDFLRDLETIYEMVRLVFPTDQEKIMYLYSKSQSHQRQQIREVVKKPGPNRTFDFVFEKVFRSGSNDSWVETLHEHLDKATNSDFDFAEYRKWLLNLDMETNIKISAFLCQKMHNRNQLLKNKYEKGDPQKAMRETNRHARYTPLPKPTKYTRQQFSTPKQKAWKPNKREQTKNWDDSKYGAKSKPSE